MTRLFAGVAGATVASSLPIFLVGALAVQLTAALDLSPLALGLVGSAYFASSSVSAIPLGRLIDDQGWVRGLHLATGLSVASLLGLGVLARSAWSTALLLGLGGMAHSASTSASSLAIVRAAPADRAAFLFGARHAAGPAAFAVAGLSVPVVALTVGWRSTFVLASAISLVGIVLTQRAVPVHTSEPHASARRAVTPPPEDLADDTAAGVGRVVASLLGAAAASALVSFFVLSATEVQAISPSLASSLMAVCAASGILGRLTAGWAVGRWNSTGFGPVAALMLVGGVGYALLAAPSRAAVVAGGLLGFGAGWAWPGMLHFVMARRRPSAPAQAVSGVHAAMAAGGAIGPATFGFLAQTRGFPLAWLALGSLSAIAAAMTMGRPRQRPSPGISSGPR